MTTGGVDSAQALILAFSLVATEIFVSDQPIYWFDEDDDLSLPCSAVHAKDVAARTARFENK